MSDYAPSHERANIITHLFGFIFGLVGLPFLVVAISESAETSAGDLAGGVVYGIGFLMVFGFSTLYHAQKETKPRMLMKIWDHISIYYLIVGTYTPFLLAYDYPEFKVLIFKDWINPNFGIQLGAFSPKCQS